MNQSEQLSLLNRISQEGISFAHGKGFSFFRNILLPAVEKFEELGSNHELLSDCWYVIGDIYDFNDAPLMAIKAYKKSIQFDAEFAAAFREIANMQERIGEYDSALENIKTSIGLDPTDELALSELNGIEESIKFNTEPLYEKGNLIWELSELLSQQNFKHVIELSSRSKELGILKKRACAYGSLNHFDKYLQVWEEIEMIATEIELEYADWFYLPKELYESDRIWLIFKKLNDRIKPSVFHHSDSLIDNYPKLSLFERRELVLNYKVYKNTNSFDELSKLKMKFPDWPELKKY